MTAGEKQALLAEIESIRLRYGLAGVVVYAWAHDRTGVVGSSADDGYELAADYVVDRMRSVVGEASAISHANKAREN